MGGLCAAVALGLILALLAPPAGAAFPGKNGKIVFMSDRVTPNNPTGDREIFVMSASGTGITQLTKNEAQDQSPTFSADGKKIVFDSDRDGDPDIFVMNADGSRQTKVTDHPPETWTADREPSFSPNGKLIVFGSNRTTGEGVDNASGDMEIFVVKADGTGLRQLTHNENTAEVGPPNADDQMPVFSPSGKKIAFITNRDRSPEDNNTEIYTMDASGLNETNLSRNPASDGRPDWSPDGKKMVFNSERDGNLEIYTMNANGTGSPLRLTNNTVGDNLPVFSPDGRQIAFQSQREGNFEIYRMKANGSLQTMVSDEVSGGSFIPDWQPLPRR